MAVQTTLKRNFIGWNVLYLTLTLGLGIWGAYDYWVKYPQMEANADEFQRLTEEQQLLTEKSQSGGVLTEAEKKQYSLNEAELSDRFDNTPPQRPAAYDRPLNFWAYFIGCGVLGAPWFAWRLLTQKRMGPRLEEDGSLVTKDGQFTSDQITGIDMSKWMSKSVARVTISVRDDPVILDDYIYKDTYLIVGKLAHQFEPDEWTEEAKPVK